jgi:DNA-binding XRE family transcriptional regulator
MTKEDTSTAAGFDAACIEIFGNSMPRASLVLRAPESTVKSWRREKRPVHPTAGVMMDWLLDGYRPPDWHMTGDQLKAARTKLDLTEDQLAQVLDIETSTYLKWESDFQGPPGFVANAVNWLLDGYRPSNWPS